MEAQHFCSITDEHPTFRNFGETQHQRWRDVSRHDRARPEVQARATAPTRHSDGPPQTRDGNQADRFTKARILQTKQNQKFLLQMKKFFLMWPRCCDKHWLHSALKFTLKYNIYSCVQAKFLLFWKSLKRNILKSVKGVHFSLGYYFLNLYYYRR